MRKFKAFFIIYALIAFTLLHAQEDYEKAFKHQIEEMVLEGNISSVSRVACQNGNCRIDDLVVVLTDPESGVLSSLFAAQFKVINVGNFMALENRVPIAEGEVREFGFEIKDIQVDGHNLLFDERRMSKELGEKSTLLRYFKQHLNTPTDGSYRLMLKKQSGDIKMQDSGKLTIGKFGLTEKINYTIKGGLEKLESLSAENPVGMFSYIVINSVEIGLKNPKGFLRKLLYVNYKEQMQKAVMKEERAQINARYYLFDDKLHSETEFGEILRVNARIRIKEQGLKDPDFNLFINPNRQFEKKADAILAGESEGVSVKINNPHGLSLSDFFIIFMGYAMQEEFAVKPDITITIQ